MNEKSKKLPAGVSDSELGAADRWIEVVAEQVKATRFGVVQIVIHDSRVVQIDHTERTRFTTPSGRE